MNPIVKKNLFTHGFLELNKMQEEVSVSCKNVPVSILLSPTGSGKTLAFMVPAAETILSLKKPKACSSVILSPTRELALQNASAGAMLLEGSGTASGALYGQMTKKRFSDVLHNPPALLSATPGKLLEAMQLFPALLSNTRFLVIDEFDRLFDMGFEKDVCSIIRRTAPDHIVLASASFEQEAKNFIRIHFRNRTRIFNYLNKNRPQIEKIEQAAPAGKIHLCLRDFIVDRKLNRVIIFCPTITDCRHLCHELSLDGFKTALITSAQTQKQRFDALEAFKTGKTPILVATDVMARGIDIGGVEAVISVGAAKTTEDMRHRAGRTARYGNKGLFLSLALEPDKDFQNPHEERTSLPHRFQEVSEDIDIETFE